MLVQHNALGETQQGKVKAAEDISLAGSLHSPSLVGGAYPQHVVTVPSGPRAAIQTQTGTIAELETEIRNLAKKFGNNRRVAAKYHHDRAKLIVFLTLIGRLAEAEQFGPKKGATEPETIAASAPITFTKTVEELGLAAGLTAFEVDKYLRWATKGLQVLNCVVPKDKVIRERVITIDPAIVKDLERLLDPAKRVGIWDKPVEVAVNRFKYKSLSAFALNVAVGCSFGCRFCYVPSASTLFLGWRLLRYGILDADNEWGTYCLIRRWDEDHYRASLRRMLAIPAAELAPDGHRAIMLCTNTDPYQPVFHSDPAVRAKLHEYLCTVVRRSLEILLEPEFAAFNVRLQTRGLAVENDFDLLRQFGNRLLLGMSIPSLDNALVKLYEPKAPAPTRRLEVLAKAAEQGIPIYVAMAPTFPECDEADIRRTLTAFSALPFHTIFHEAINARAKNVDRIVEEAERRERLTGAEIIRQAATRIPYAIEQMQLVERVATEAGVGGKLHLWPDEELLDEKVIAAQNDPRAFRTWLHRYHSRISEWPGSGGAGSYNPYQGYN